MMHILFVCTGNTCRSPMCAALVNAGVFNVPELTATSAGLYADQEPISRNAVLALENEGIRPTKDNPYPNHLSHTVTKEDIESASLVVGVTVAHASELKRRFPQYADKIVPLPTGILDPYGADLAGYTCCLHEIKESLQALLCTINP